MPPTAQPKHAQYMSLDQVERVLVAGDHAIPSDLAILKASTRALQAMAGPARAFATIVCEPLSNGSLRVVEGKDAVLVARRLRARAVWRGDDAWAGLLGRTLLFHVVTEDATSRRSSRRRGPTARAAPAAATAASSSRPWRPARRGT